ncbi:MAG: YeeE/YedE thiosulfate transporter family protein [Caldimicrobium sp.]|nr:YeeE/YedE thiosulfate transporter family protein [Caldimicrobium sp.]MCX7612737.1 YeeE/YedE thiosulfate transporter family protein [Caldimicrobium sp.]
MSLKDSLKELYQSIFKAHYSPIAGGILLALFVILLEMWYRPWGIVGGLRNWGEWILYGIGFLEEAPPHPLWFSSSVLNIGLILGAFISATMAQEFGLRIPPKLEIIKGIVAGILMGIGSALAQGCNIGGFYMAIANLSASGIAMMVGLIAGVFIGVKYLLWEIERFASTGGVEISTKKINPILGIVGLIVLFAGVSCYFGSEREEGALLGGALLITAGIGFVMHRSRFCIVNSFREPFLSGEASMARGVAISILIATLGIMFIKLAGIREPMTYVTPTFVWGALIGGVIFGAAMVVAGGCGSGSLWRVAEGQVKLMIVVVFFALTNAILRYYLDNVWEVWDKGWLGTAVYLPDLLGYAGAFILLAVIILLWYIIVDWNEKTEKFVIGL